MKLPPDDYDLHAYVDGRLNASERAAVELWLERNPERATQLREWRSDAQQLRAMLESVPMPPQTAPLDPALLRARLSAQIRVRLSFAASLLLCLGLGTMGGWQLHNWRQSASPPMADALTAYRLMVVDRAARIDVAERQPGDLQTWVENEVGARIRLPDLTAAGFRPVGGRLFASERGTAAMVLYQDHSGHQLSFYVRPPGVAQRLLVSGQRREGDLTARFGSANGFNYAVVGQVDSLDQVAVTHALDTQI